MRINIGLPKMYEKKWQRIAAFLGEDVDALIVHGIDYVWDRYGKDIEATERMAARYKRNLARSEIKLRSSKVSNMFVGNFNRKVDATGRIRLPKCWLQALSKQSEIWCLSDAGNDLCIMSCDELAKCSAKVRKHASALAVDAAGKLKLDVGPNKVGAGADVILRGCIRYIKITVLT